MTFSAVANRAEADSSKFDVRIATQNTFDAWRVANLQAGKSLQFTWGGIPGNVMHTGAVDPAGLVVEADETNNQVSQELWIKSRYTFLPVFWLTRPD